MRNYRKELNNIRSYREGFVQSSDWVESLRAMEELIESNEEDYKKIIFYENLVEEKEQRIKDLENKLKGANGIIDELLDAKGVNL